MDIEKMLADVSNEAKRAIIEDRLAMWRNTIFQLEIDAQVAKIIGEPLDGIKKKTEQTVKAVSALQELLAQYPEPEKDAE